VKESVSGWSCTLDLRGAIGDKSGIAVCGVEKLGQCMVPYGMLVKFAWRFLSAGMSKQTLVIDFTEVVEVYYIIIVGIMIPFPTTPWLPLNTTTSAARPTTISVGASHPVIYDMIGPYWWNSFHHTYQLCLVSRSQPNRMKIVVPSLYELCLESRSMQNNAHTSALRCRGILLSLKDHEVTCCNCFVHYTMADS